jgi:hypothetical protein
MSNLPEFSGYAQSCPKCGCTDVNICYHDKSHACYPDKCMSEEHFIRTCQGCCYIWIEGVPKNPTSWDMKWKRDKE